jgi:REP element-mobilizing transposase RayT
MMKFTDEPGRRSIRLTGYDYTQAGAYFVTICTHDRACLFGDVVDGAMQLNEAGHIAEKCWMGMPDYFPHAALDTFVVMPNHIHGIIVIPNIVGAKNLSPDLLSCPSPLRNKMPFQSPSMTVGSIIRGFKTGVTKWFRIHTDIYNPIQWVFDHENPNSASP